MKVVTSRAVGRYALPMSDMSPSGSTAVAEVDSRRSCTRCDGEQTLVGEASGFGKYQCEQCQLVIGFDLESEPAEFLLDRGNPGRYSKDQFGSQLTPSERRLP